MWEENDIKEVLFTGEQISERAKQLGAQITKDYSEKGSKPFFVALLKGSVPFLVELTRNIDLDLQFDFMDVSSYEGTESTGDIRILKDLDISVKGMDIIIVEDIVDTGRTLSTVCELLLHRGASSVKIATLLDKPSRRINDVRPEYIGFEVGNQFVVGYGMDFNQRYRALPYVGSLKEDCYK